MYPLFKQRGKILLSSFKIFKSGSFYVQSLKVREMVMIICKCLADYVGLCVLDFGFYFLDFFVNDVILLASSSADLQLTLEQFVAE